MGRKLLSILISLVFCVPAFGAPDQTMSISPTASSGETITASDENARNNEISTKYNAHGHTDTDDLDTNTLTIGDNAVGNKTYAVDTDQANNPALRYNTSTDQWTLSQDGSTFLAAAHAETTAGLTSGSLIYAVGGTVSGGIADAGVASNGQFLIGRTGGTPTIGGLTGSNGVTITNGAGTIDVSSPAFAAPALTLGTANSAGAASTIIRSDATVAAFDATVPTTMTYGAAAATGSAAIAARRDHTHGGVASPAWQWVESLDASSGTTLTSATLPTDSDLFMIVFENVTGTAAQTITMAGVATRIRLSGTTLSTAGTGVIAETGTTNSKPVNGVMYVPRLAQNSINLMTCSISFEETSGSVAATTLRAEGTANFTEFAFTVSGAQAFTGGKIHIYKSIPS